MIPPYWIPLIAIGFIWLMAWRCGLRWVHHCGVTEPASVLALSCILPTAGLIASVHVLALLSLFFKTGWVSPAATCVTFAAFTWFAHRTIPGSVTIPLSVADNLRKVTRTLRCGYLWIPVVIVCGIYAVFLIDALTRFPTGYDAQSYHLPMAATWMLQQNLGIEHGHYYSSYPENGIIVPFLLSFPRWEWLLPIVNLPKALLAAAAVFGLTRATGFRRRTSIIVACICLSVPMVVFQSFSSYIDLYAASAWLCSLLALSWAARTSTAPQRRSLIFMAGLAGGLALGSKTTFLVMTPLLGMVAMALDWIGPHAIRRDRRTPLLNAAVFGTAALACSGFWFVRGTVQAGNPIYPLGIKIGDTQLLPGYEADQYFPDRSLTTVLGRWWHYPWTETKYSGTGYTYGVNNGLGASYATFVIPGILMALAIALRRRSFKVTDRLRLTFLALTITGALLVLTVFHEMLRFVFPQVLLGVVAASAIIETLAQSYRRSMIAILSCSLLITGAVATLRPVHALAGRVKDGTWDRAAFYEIPEIVDQLPPGTRILNLADALHAYPLLGRRLTNTSINMLDWTALHGDAPLSAKALHHNRIDYIYVDAITARQWAEDLPVELVSGPGETRALPGASQRQLYRVVTAAPNCTQHAAKKVLKPIGNLSVLDDELLYP